jgi:uncharacterized membrane protein
MDMTENEILREIEELRMKMSNLAYELAKINKNRCMEFLHQDIRSISSRLSQVAKDYNWQHNP